MGRLARFLRSVIPGDPFQLLFLFGVVFLFISSNSRWWPRQLVDSFSDTFPRSSASEQYSLLRRTLILATCPLVVAGLSGFFLCLWPVKKPIRWVFLSVIVPVILSLGLIGYAFYVTFNSPRSVFSTHPSSASVFDWLTVNSGSLPVGVYVAVAGLALCLAFASRLVMGASTLPLKLHWRLTGEKKPDSADRLELLVFVFIGPIFFLDGLATIALVFVPEEVAEHFKFVVPAKGLVDLYPMVAGLVMVAILALLLGKMGLREIKRTLRLPERRCALGALVVPIAVFSASIVSQFLIARAQWAAEAVHRFDPPVLASYFGLQGLRQPWLLLLVFGAFAEEIVFRGVMLPRFIQRYGLQSGIFLTGIVWSATHFRSDVSSAFSVSEVLLQLLQRILVCLALNYMFAWMTLRWHSIVPSGIAHSVWNVLAIAGVGSIESTGGELRWILLVLLACAVFHYWPLEGQGESASGVQVATLESTE
jgi:membrane protease YdiL (CAAX protease family)